MWGKKNGKNVKITPYNNTNNKKQNLTKKSNNDISVRSSTSFSPSYSPLFSPGFSTSFSPSVTPPPPQSIKEKNKNYSRQYYSLEKKKFILRGKNSLIGRDKWDFVVFGFDRYVYHEMARRAIVKWNRYVTVQYSTVR